MPDRSPSSPARARREATHDGDVIRTSEDPSAIDADAWDALLATQSQPTPFMRHAYLAALHASESAVPRTGWQPLFVTVHRDAALVGACALYAKSHSYGEYVFDWSWAQAFERHGRRYYPKLLGAVPFTPVPGSRLLATDDRVRAVLVDTLATIAHEARLSSVHVLFPAADEIDAFERAGWMIRRGVQFHWSQPASARWPTFDAFLASLHRDKRKKIAQEQRRVREAGVTFRVREGATIATAEWDFFYRCYAQTYAEHGSHPYLTRAFFDAMARTMPEAWVMFIAERDGRDIATSLIAVDESRGAAYGRYWGATTHVPLLHFDACYYQPLAWCIGHGYDRFEGGAQGEHKMARGLMPVATASAHWVADADFARAIGDFLVREREGMAQYVDELNERSPYRSGDASG